MPNTPAQLKAQAKWREKNRETVRAYNKKYRKANPKKAMAATERWRKENREKHLATKRAWLRKNKDKVNAQRRERWHDLNPGKKYLGPKSKAGRARDPLKTCSVEELKATGLSVGDFL